MYVAVLEVMEGFSYTKIRRHPKPMPSRPLMLNIAPKYETQVMYKLAVRCKIMVMWPCLALTRNDSYPVIFILST